MNPLLVALLGLAVVGAVAGCGQSSSEVNASVPSTQAPITQTMDARFGKEFVKACDLLTEEMVASAFNIPAAKLKRNKVMGCIYSWSDDGVELSARIFMPRAHSSASAAASWFAQATKNQSAEEVAAQLDQVSARLDQSAKLDTQAKKSAAKMMLGAIGSKAVRYEDLPNLGDEARLAEDGGLHVRVDNLTFNVSAYYGPKQPETKVNGLAVKEMIAAIKQEAAAWEVAKAPHVRRDSEILARAILAKL